ncbi:hypothetical protein [uncultured Paracoccus sp.]|uniref:hypothetical protein n=1 Tax=uncultured Paracoccus sp. TaxID=189685 RepID=UPI0025937A02|nr:hypothetical protein [uncultured Paracoccus sp.]
MLDRDFWASLSPQDWRAILDRTGLALARSQVAYQQGVASAPKGGGGRGVIVSDASPAIEARLKEFQDGMLAGLAKRTMKQRGIDDPTPVIDEYPALARK